MQTLLPCPAYLQGREQSDEGQQQGGHHKPGRAVMRQSRQRRWGIRSRQRPQCCAENSRGKDSLERRGESKRPDNAARVNEFRLRAEVERSQAGIGRILWHSYLVKRIDARLGERPARATSGPPSSRAAPWS
ncbi:MAG: hypothetical protein J0I21_12435 [Alphaproteobacteria bacterium]|nr:hypothetical protein [Alphaproteobacteria bacterium]